MVVWNRMRSMLWNRRHEEFNEHTLVCSFEVFRCYLIKSRRVRIYSHIVIIRTLLLLFVSTQYYRSK